jgi:hypothetical protein
MALTKEISVDQITITENGVVRYREAIRIMEDSNQLSQTYHRTSLEPGQDVTDQNTRVQAICNAVWTPAVIAAYEAQQEAAKLG